MVMTGWWQSSWEFLQGVFTVPNVHKLFTRHRLEWMARSLVSYSEEFIREFYGSYVAIILWRGGRNLPNRTHSQRSYFKDAGWTFLLLPSTASCAVCPLVLRGIPLLRSLIIRGIWSRVANLREAEIRESPSRGRLHNSCPFMVREQIGCWTLETLSERPTSLSQPVLLAVSPPPSISHGSR